MPVAVARASRLLIVLCALLGWTPAHAQHKSLFTISA